MKYAVRYEIQGFVEKETFNDLKSAKRYFDKVLNQFGDWLIDLQFYKIK